MAKKKKKDLVVVDSAPALKPDRVLYIPPTMVIALDLIDPFFTDDGLTNPNEMSAMKLSLLTDGIAEYGFLQSVLVRAKPDGRYGLLDGHHRVEAARAAGFTEISAIVLPETADWKALGHALGLNRLRGDMNVTAAAELMQMMQEEAHVSASQISLLTGFSEVEVAALLEAGSTDNEDALMEDVAGAHDEGEERLPKPFLLEITFETSTQRSKVKRALKKAAGSTKDLAIGLMSILDIED